MSSFRIILLCIVASIFYGIAHDQVTARLCVEYFTVFHPRIIESTDPTVLALVWGVVATWWVGLLIGIPLAICSRVGRRPRICASELVRPIGIMFALIAAFAFAAGAVAHWAVTSGRVEPLQLFPWMRDRIPQERHTWFLVDLAAHNAAYLVGAIGGIILCIRTFRSRSNGVGVAFVKKETSVIDASVARESYQRISVAHQSSLEKLAD